MQAHTRAIVAASAFAFVSRTKIAGVYDHAAGLHRRIAAESRDDRVQAVDGDRSAKFEGTLPELYDRSDASFVSMEINGATARGYDRGTGGFYEAQVNDSVVQLFDHVAGSWFAYTIQTIA